VTPAGVAALLEAGVNRLSLGVQSLDDRELALLGRRADRATTLRALQAVRAAGCDNLSCDLMFALPGQTLTRLGETLDEVMALGPEHVSAYGLTVEDGTPFGVARRAGTLTLPAEGLGADMFELVCERLGAAGYEHYEISNFARPGRAAVHNTLYWVGSEYLGLGAAAHSMRFLDGGSPPARIERRANVRSPEAYLAAARGGRHEPGEREELDLAAQRREGLWLWLRLVAGVDRDAFARRYGVDPAAVDPEATAGLERQGLLAVTPARLQLTRRGVLFADEVALAFL
jgi:oxygen-independent coproporphyrinogen-3 oxidase